tara:strand:+ start:2162 stop:2842 length:681 start_codon:yes stop_codon:yes gene_type:complete
VKKILVVSCTRQPKQHKQGLLIYQSLVGLQCDVKLEIIYENKESLPVVYNKYITEKNNKKHDIVLFVHDDVYIDDLKLKGKLYGAIKQFDIVGLAGTLYPRIQAPVLWHKMADRKHWRGIVNHPYDNDVNVIQSTNFGPTPSRVAIMDGLFMAVSLKKALQSGWKFNENFSYHHYDISSCLDANVKMLKLGVVPVNVIHQSPGLTNYKDDDFQKSQNKFLEIYTGH